MKHTGADFLGTGWSFPPSFDASLKQVHLVSEEQDIQQSLHILLSTSTGERIMHPTFGCDLHQVVFDNISQTTVSEIKDIIRRAILFFEPRITLLDIHVDISSQQYLEGIINIDVEYLVRRTNTRSNMVFPFYFLEGTNL